MDKNKLMEKIQKLNFLHNMKIEEITLLKLDIEELKEMYKVKLQDFKKYPYQIMKIHISKKHFINANFYLN